MNYSEIIIGDRVLVQSNVQTKEVARIKGLDEETGIAIVMLLDGSIREMHPQFILKSFGQS